VGNRLLECAFLYGIVCCPCSGSLSLRHGASSGSDRGTASDMEGSSE